MFILKSNNMFPSKLIKTMNITKECIRNSSGSHSRDYLKERLCEIVPVEREKLKKLKAEHGSKIIDNTSVEQVLGGMRSMKAVYHNNSILDAAEGIKFRGLTCNAVRAKLPKAFSSQEPIAEGIFWLLLTGELPTKNEVEWLSHELARRGELPHNLINVINTFPDNLHPMAQLSAAINTLSRYSRFAEAYHKKSVKKEDLWIPMYEDCLDLVAKVPVIAAKIYRNTYHDGQLINLDPSKDWAYNFAKMLAVNNSDSFVDFMRLYLVVHSDHEGGNVSSHTAHLVGSSLSDAYLSYAASMNGLAGPLHGRANQEVMEFLTKILDDMDDSFKDPKKLEQYVRNHLKTSVVPGFGHAALRITDPRYTIFTDFVDANIRRSPRLDLVKRLYDIVPNILMELGKVKNPYPNVDCISGSVLDYYNLKEMDFYTVPFALARCLGVSSSLVWDRALGLPLERPKSVDFATISELAKAPLK